MTVVAKTPFLPVHPQVLALYCSDGRYTRAVEELAQALGHPRIDVLCVPGGPGAMDAWTTGSVIFAEHLRSQAGFLITGHHITEVLLISHEGCGFYKAQHERLDEPERRQRQAVDLRRAADTIRRDHPGVQVRTFHANHTGDRIVFEPVTDAASSHAPSPTAAR